MKKLSMAALRTHRTPKASITLWWLGQAGFIFKSPAGKLVALDPYLSNSCKAIGDQHGFDMNRQVPSPIPAAKLAGIDALRKTSVTWCPGN